MTPTASQANAGPANVSPAQASRARGPGRCASTSAGVFARMSPEPCGELGGCWGRLGSRGVLDGGEWPV
jgi:hypothetical protein